MKILLSRRNFCFFLAQQRAQLVAAARWRRASYPTTRRRSASLRRTDNTTRTPATAQTQAVKTARASHEHPANNQPRMVKGPRDRNSPTWTHWGLNPGPSACEADVIPLRHVPVACGQVSRRSVRTVRCAQCGFAVARRDAAAGARYRCSHGRVCAPLFGCDCWTVLTTRAARKWQGHFGRVVKASACVFGWLCEPAALLAPCAPAALRWRWLRDSVTEWLR